LGGSDTKQDSLDDRGSSENIIFPDQT